MHQTLHVRSPSILFETSAYNLARTLRHKSFHATRRHGKYLFILVDKNKWLVMHFGMTGNLQYFQHEHETPAYTRLLIGFENGCQLAYISQRKPGRIAFAESPQTWIRKQNLGPDALEVGEELFFRLAARRRGGLKSWLMDQYCIAGIGNMYSAEILFQAKIHPCRAVSDLDNGELARLYKAMQSVLNKAIRAQAEPGQMPAAFLLRQRTQDGCCPACGTPLETLRAADRRAWFCPVCQTR